MKKYIVRYQKINTDKIKIGKFHTANISNFIRVMGEYGYHVIVYAEFSPDNLKLVKTY